MAHPRWPGFNFKTGNPVHDNISRRINQRLYRDVKSRFRVTAVGRKRKKLLKRVEGGKYVILVLKSINALDHIRAKESQTGEPKL